MTEGYHSSYQISSSLYLSRTLVCSIFIHIRQKEKSSILSPYDKCEPGLTNIVNVDNFICIQLLKRIYVQLSKAILKYDRYRTEVG